MYISFVTNIDKLSLIDMKNLIVKLILFFLLASQAYPQIIKSPVTKVSLIELYTSQSCSSCPPAESWLNRLITSNQLWKNVVPVAFHVDYWNYLHWKDPFSKSAFSQRQREYAKRSNSRQIYTPQFILDGSSWRIDNLKLNTERVGRITLDLNNTKESVSGQFEFKPKLFKGKNAKLNIALLGGGIAVNISKGENAGKTLKHEFTVLDFKQIDIVRDMNIFKEDFIFTKLKNNRVSTYKVAAWVTTRDEREVIQSAGGEII